MTRLLLLILVSIFISNGTFAQSMSWKKHRNLADELFQKRNYAEAAENYAAAYDLKDSNKELTYKAGECYYLVRDFKNAAISYEKIKDENNLFQLVGLKYARCLKQDGQYDAASRELVYFLNNYDAPNKVIIEEIVQKELSGCELGIKEKELVANTKLTIEHLDKNVNSTNPEFAPIPFSDGILYFSSMRKGKAKIFRSQLQDGEWGRATLPRGFKSLEDQHFCNGSFTPDTKSFYFTICEQGEAWGGGTSTCAIYNTSRKGSSWTTPEKLPDFVNALDATTTQPYVLHKDGKEVIYFSSNRKGGNGGMDIWYTERRLSDGKMEFSFPINLGSEINTSGDDITPFYDPSTEMLYFSSNGHVSIGGYDVYKSMGSKETWTTAQNLGMPVNSPADDNYYTKVIGTEEGFLVSNRSFGADKLGTTQEDIFAFSTPEEKMIVNGKILNESGTAAVNGVTVALYELTSNGQRKLWTAKDFEYSDYSFRLIPNKRFILEATKEGYANTSVEVNTLNANQLEYSKEIIMKSKVSGATDSSVTIIEEPTAETPVVEEPVVEAPSVVVETPEVEQPVVETSIVETPIIEEPIMEVPPAVEEMPIVEETIVEAPPVVIETPLVEEPIMEVAPAVEEMPVVEEPIIETPPVVIETPIVEEPVFVETPSIPARTTTTTIESSPDYSSSTIEESPSTSVIYSESPTVTSSEINTTTSSSPPKNVYTSGNVIYSDDTIIKYSSVPHNEGLHRYFSENLEISSTAPRHTGTYYKIQIISVERYNQKSSRYSPVMDLGRMDTEYIYEKGWTRVLIADFFSESEAREMLETVRDRGFDRAFIVKYKDGDRVKRVR